MDQHPVYPFYKAARCFDPEQLPVISHDLADYSAVTKLASSVSTTEMKNEWVLYMQIPAKDLPETLNLEAYWYGMKTRFPIMSAIAKYVIWMPTTSVDVERSFSQYKHLLDDRRESLTEANTRKLMILYSNGDIVLLTFTLTFSLILFIILS